MDDTVIIPDDDMPDAPVNAEGLVNALSAAKRKKIGEARTAPPEPEARRKKQAKSAKATKRLTGLLKVHGGTDKEIAKALNKRAAAKEAKPKTTVPVKARKAAAQVVDGLRKVKKALKSTPKAGHASVNAKGSVKSKKEVKGKLTMGRSYQRGSGATQGTEVAGGGRQTVVTFPGSVFKVVAKAALANGVSFSEEVRRCVARVHKG
jgi:hypothetical protein